MLLWQVTVVAVRHLHDSSYGQHARASSPEAPPLLQERFWQRDKWLQNGVLLCIQEHSTHSTRSHLVEVAARNPKELAHQCRNHQRISVGVRFCHGGGSLQGLALLSRSLARTANNEREQTLGGNNGAHSASGAAGRVLMRAPDDSAAAGDGAGGAQGQLQDPRAAAAAAAAARAAAAQAAESPAAGDRGQGTSSERCVLFQWLSVCLPALLCVSKRRSLCRPHTSAAAAPEDAHAPAAAAEQVQAVAAWTAVQVAHDYAIARPVLEALQEERLVTPPFGGTLFSETQPPAARPVAAPMWQNDPEAAVYLQPRVEALDAAQRDAFEHALSREVALIQGPPGRTIFIHCYVSVGIFLLQRYLPIRYHKHCRLHLLCILRVIRVSSASLSARARLQRSS